MNKALKYRRGQVWFLCESSTERTRFRTGLQSDNRPALIISGDFGNATNDTVIVCKLTHTSRPMSINHAVIGEDGKPSYILCNQICTVPKSQLTKYMWSISDEDLSAVMKCICTAMDYSPKADSDVTLDKIKKLVEDTATLKFHELSTEKENQEMIYNIGTGLEQLYSSLCKQYVANLNAAQERLKAGTPTLNLVVNGDDGSIKQATPSQKKDVRGCLSYTPRNPEAVADKKDIKKIVRPKGYWTDDVVNNFLKDREIMKGFEQKWAEKYLFPTVKQAMKAYYNYRWKLKKESNS